MRVAALYDVHGNLPALEAVLAELDDAELIVAGGDVVGGAFPAETVERLRELGGRVRWLRGNAERELVEMPPPREAGPPPGELERLPRRTEYAAAETPLATRREAAEYFESLVRE